MKCPMCVSENISPETETLERGGAIFADKNTLPRKPVSVVADKVRICLDCGYNMYFSSKKELKKLEGRAIDKVFS